MQRQGYGWVAFALCAAPGCAETLRSEDVRSGDAAIEGVRIDATRSDRWVYFDLETELEVEPEAPEDSEAWDLAFQRYEVRTNGGTSGSQDVAVTRLTDVSFEDVTVAPSDGYVSDVEQDGDDEGESPDYAFLLDGGWYNYNPRDHTLSPRDVVYVVRTVEGNFMKLEFLGYYSEIAEAGFVSFRYEAVAAPDGAMAVIDSGVPSDAGVPRLDAAMDVEVP